MQAILGALILEIEHTGSTTVPGLLAKPIIDILEVVKDVDLIRNDEPMLQKLGYSKTGLVQAEQHLICSKGNPSTHHIHFVGSATLKGTSHPRFRDKLKEDPAFAQEYARVKMDLAARHRHDPKAYSEEKGRWIQARNYPLRRFQSG